MKAPSKPKLYSGENENIVLPLARKLYEGKARARSFSAHQTRGTVCTYGKFMMYVVVPKSNIFGRIMPYSKIFE